MTPILFYDNECKSCTKYAQIADKLSGHRLKTIGLYTDEADELRNSTRYWAEMSWFAIDGQAYGGRKGLLRLLRYIIFEGNGEITKNDYRIKECKTDCMTVKGVWFRSMSILTMSNVIQFKPGFSTKGESSP